MRLTFKTLFDAQRPNEGFVPLAFAFVASIGALALTNYLGKAHRQQYGVYIKDFEAPKDTLYKMPGVYIKKEEDENG